MIINQNGANSDGKYLDVHTLHVGDKEKKVAYLVGTLVKTSNANNKGFIRFFLNDCNGLPVSAIMFDIPQYEDIGAKLIGLKKRPVEITYRVSEWNGSISLHIEQVERWSGKFDLDKFLGKFEGADTHLQKAVSDMRMIMGTDEATSYFNMRFRDASFLSLGYGQVGLFTKVIVSSMVTLYNYKGFPGIDIKQLFLIFEKSINLYAKGLELKEKTNVVLIGTLHEEVFGAAQSIEDSHIRNIFSDTAMALLGLSEPQHLYANLIMDAVKSSEDGLHRIFNYATMLPGFSKEVGGRTLVKY